MARTKRRQDLNKVGGQDTLMPVSPKDQTVEKGLGRDGETANDGGRCIEVDHKVDEDSGQ